MYALFPISHVKNWNFEQLFALILFVNKNNMTDLSYKRIVFLVCLGDSIYDQVAHLCINYLLPRFL